FQLLVDASAPLDTPIRLLAFARDAGGVAPPAIAALSLSTCGTPSAISVDPAEGPLGGNVSLLIFGSGFASGITSFTLGTTALAQIDVTSGTIARALLPSGSYSAGFVDLAANNDCAGSPFSSSLPNAFRFVAPPAVELVRPHSGATAVASAELPAI